MIRRDNSPKVTPEIAAKIKCLLANTNLNQAQIGAMFGGINQGRVSEIDNCKRFADVKPCSMLNIFAGRGGL